MIKPACVEKELFLSLKLKEEDLNFIFDLRKKIADYYGIKLKENVNFHVTVDRIYKEYKNEAYEIAKKVFKNEMFDKLYIKNIKCFMKNNNFLSLELEKSEKLLNFSSKLHKELLKKGLTTITESYNYWNYHLTIINNVLEEGIISEQDFENICLVLKGNYSRIELLIEGIEVLEFPKLKKL